jgi:hypothetical protein
LTDVQGFLAGLAATVVVLGGVIVSGLRERRRVHIPLVIVFFATLGTTIWFAERMGRDLDLKAAGWITPVHLTLAKVTTLAYTLPMISGLLALSSERWKARHKRLAWLLIAMTVATVATGAWMALAAPRLAR